MSKRVAIPGSDRAAPPGAVAAGSVPAERISVTVLVRPRTPPQDTARAIAAVAPSARRYLTREEFAERHGADPQDVLAVERFAVDAGLLVLEADCARRSVVLEGAPNELAAAFGTSLALYRSGDTVFRGRVGTLSIPVSLDGIVTGVFGLDERPQARAQVRIRPALANATSYTPLQVAQAYAFPSGLDGTGQTIALIELGGGFAQSDLEAYFASIGLAPPNVTSVSVDGGQNGGGKDPNGADGEVLLDIEVAGAVAPGAKIVVYFAPNTDQGFIDAVSTAIHDTSNDPTIVSISWGGAESTWTAQAISALDSAIADGATLGVTVLCAAGDSGSSDGVADGKAH